MTDHSKAYTETCEMIRHYSSASLNVRILCFVQGLGVFVAWAIYFSHGNHLLSVLLPLCGLAFTGFAYYFHQGYYTTTGKYYDLAKGLEEKIFEDKTFRALSLFVQYHYEKYKTRFSKFLIINAPFTMIALVFIAAFIFSVFSVFC